MGVYLPLPSEYQEVEYIQSDRSVGQYIHTNIIPTNTTGLYMRVSSQNVTNDGVYCGAATNNTDSGDKFGLGNARSKIYYGWNRWSEDSYRPATSTNTIVELESNYMNSRVFKKDGVIYTDGSGNASYSNTLSTINYPLNIFGHNGANTAQYFSSIKLYNLKVSDGSSIIADFVPCYRKSDNVVGLYDLVNNQFYTNSGSGTFTKGADVTAVPLKNAYIGEVYYKYSYDFRGKTTAILTSDGWTGTMSGTINNDGISGNWSIKQGGKDFSNANKKFTLTVNGNVISKSEWDSGTMGLQIVNSDGSLIYGGGASSLSSSYSGARVYYHSTSSSRSNYNLAIGAYVVKCVIDLQAKTIRTDVYSNGTSVTNTSTSLTDAYITELKGLTYISTRTGSGTRISDISMERE